MTTQRTVGEYMSVPARTVRPDASLSDAYELMESQQVSGLPVCDAHGMVVGVVSRTDLLRVGRVQTRAHAGDHPPLLLFTEETCVSDAMTRDPICVDESAPIQDAAALLVQHKIHRLAVLGPKGRAVGVLSTKEMLIAVHDAKVLAPISSVMTVPVHALPVWAPLSYATDRLAASGQSGVVIIDDESWPMGVFTQVEALLSRDMPAELKVEQVMSAALLCLSDDTPLHRAAEQAFASKARRISVVKQRKVIGVVTGLDFARSLIVDGPRGSAVTAGAPAAK